ncbi:hypothetical protein HGM15179_014133, partial [Zosterops borbonicus]
GSTPWASDHYLGNCCGWSCNRLMDKSSVPSSALPEILKYIHVSEEFCGIFSGEQAFKHWLELHCKSEEGWK